MDKQVKTINILKKNRKYFVAEENGFKFKLLIDANSENLNLEQYTLELEDISKRSKYGTDFIFRVANSENIQSNAWEETSVIECDYNIHMIERARELGGKWDGKTWAFSSLVKEEAEELDFIYNSKKIPIEITAKDDLYTDREPIYFCGIQLGKAFDRDSGAKISDGISVVSGNLTSGGSKKNWSTKIEEETVIRLFIPTEVINKHFSDEENKWELKRLGYDNERK